MVKRILAILVCLAVVSGSALAQQHQVNVSGATLFADFFTAPASTNDHIDVDGDGVKGFNETTFTVDQLALDDWTLSTSHWQVIYRGVGSGNGLAELVNFYNTTPTYGDPADTGQINRTFWYEADASPPQVPGIYTPANPGGCPVMPNNVDIGVMDVPTTWFVTKGAEADSRWNATPATDGYGLNPVVGWDAGARSNHLKSLGSLNTNTASPDAQTVFDTQIAWVPITFIANRGAGVENVTQDEMQHLFITGRMDTGENLVAATRDSGSGTRNGGMSTLGVDPSWGRGDNYGAKSKITSDTHIGPNHRASNCGGSSVMEGAVQNRRLALGYTGLFGSSRSAKDAEAGKYEIINLKKDGQAVYVRPSLDSVFHNVDPNGWQIGGPETFATAGNPFGTPAMSNSHAADYINNIITSINDFVSSAGQSEDYNMPGEYMAYNYTLMSAISTLPDPLNPGSFVANSGLNTALQSFSYNGNVLNVPAYGSVNEAGKLPTRTILTGGATYSDGSTGAYIDGDGSTIGSGELAQRNRISGDFNNDGARDINDIAGLIAAVADPRGFATAEGDNGGDAGDQAGDYVIPEVIGDFDGDGNLDAKDVRYFADGLAMQAGNLDRAAGFAAVDAVVAGNYFGTTLATPAGYTYGASKADVAGNDVAPGAHPTGNDGAVDAKDIDYVYANLRQQMKIDLTGAAMDSTPVCCMVRDWPEKDDAAWMDLSCDMNGDLKITIEDVEEVVVKILGTSYGDVDLDGDVDAADKAVISANMGAAQGWAGGDVDGDGMVTAADMMVANGENPNAGDINCDGTVDLKDLAILSLNWLN